MGRIDMTNARKQMLATGVVIVLVAKGLVALLRWLLTGG
jgi:hypothetical protein